MISMISLIKCSFKVQKCEFDDLQETVKRIGQIINPSKFEEHNSTIKNETRSHFYLYIDDILNVDHLSNVFILQLQIIEFWRNVQLNDLEVYDEQAIVIKESNLSYVDSIYPNLEIDESDFNQFDKEKLFGSKFNDKKHSRQYFYLPTAKVLIKNYKFNSQNRCKMSMQNYPFIKVPCLINFRAGKSNFNYSICNFDTFKNQQFTYKKVRIQSIQ